MQSTDSPEQEEVINLLNKCWMTHDGMWFLHCLQECGIETTNRLNKSAIKSLAPFEMNRIARFLDVTLPLENYEALKQFMTEASKLVIPDFMNAAFEFPGENRMTWRFDTGDCFAYTGIKRMGAIDKYECGVLHRISCWLDSLGIQHQFQPEIGPCHRHHDGACNGHIDLFFS